MARLLRCKTGCATCRRRRKKCDERKPTCSVCARLKLRCWYGQETIAHFISTDNRGTILVQSEPATISRLYEDPPLWRFRSVSEQTAVHRAPSSVLAFYGPCCSKEVQDLRLIWQMMHHDDLLYHATIACFSLVFGRTPQYGQLCRSSYCSALQQARERLTSRILYRNDLIVLQTTVFFLGLLDSVGPEQPLDLLLHWRGLARLLTYSFSIYRVDWSSLQKNVFILVLEAAAYHLSCQMLFTKDAGSIWTLWRETRIHEMLEEINPQGVQRIANSPLMGGGGDYVIYRLVVQLTYLSRGPNLESHTDQTFDEIESTLQRLQLSLRSRLAQYRIPTYPARNVYVMFLGALSILLAALREPSHAQNQIIDDKASEVLEEFCKISSADMNHAPTSWPVQILACAIRYESDFVRFKKELAVFKTRLDPGHTKRLEAIVEQVERTRVTSNKSVRSTQHMKFIPSALGLFRKPDGILS